MPTQCTDLTQNHSNFYHYTTNFYLPRLKHIAKMGRLHSNGKGISKSAIPYSRNPPAWLKVTPDQVEDQICKLARKGATPSQIGVVLRDSHGIAQVKVVTGMLALTLAMNGSKCEQWKQLTRRFSGNKILRILKSNGMEDSSDITI